MAPGSLARVEKKARLERREIVLVDEAGFYLLPGVVRSYAPCGEPPVLCVFQTRDHLSVMSGITRRGGLFTLIRDYALTSTESALFLHHLLRHLQRKLLVIWDGSTIHRGDEVKAFLSNGGARRLHLEPFPAYAPDLNPDEGVWNYLKNVEMRNLCCKNLSDLRHELSLAIVRVRRKPEVIRSFFAGAGLDI